MQRSTLITVLLILCFSTFLMLMTLSRQKAHAQLNANEALLRFDNNIAGENPEGLLLIYDTPVVAGTEAYFALTLDDSWQSGTHFSTTPGSYQTSVSNLPTGTQAMPLASVTATAVTGQTVYFSVTDLTPNTRYAFYLQSGSSGLLLNPATSNEIIHQVSTADSDFSLLSRAYVPSPTQSNNMITLQAQILPSPSDIDIELAQQTSPGQALGQNQEVLYELSYSTSLSYPVAATIQAEWTRGTVGDAIVASVDALEYVPGSASVPQGSTSPVIDVINRTITWEVTIPASGVLRTASFRLKTTGAYTGSEQVGSTVSVGLTEPITSFSDEVTTLYQYLPSATPTPTPTPTPTASSQPIDADGAVSPTPQPVSSPGGVAPGDGGFPTATISELARSIRPRYISSESVEFSVELAQPMKLRMQYGRTPNAMNQRVTSASTSLLHTIQAMQLDAETQYYFQFVITTADGIQVLSDIYLVTTASAISTTDFSSLAVRLQSNGLPLWIVSLNAASATDSLPRVVLPRSRVYEFVVDATGSSVEKIDVRIVSNQVLGISTDRPTDVNTFASSLLPVLPQIFFTTLSVPDSLGMHTAYLHLQDSYGNYLEQEVLEILVVDPLQVVDSIGQPVEGAQVLLSKYDPSTQLLTELPSQVLGYSNPLFTDEQGEIAGILPPGRYRATVTAAQFDSTELDFVISPDPQFEQYPLIILEKKAFSLMGLANEYRDIFTHVQFRAQRFFSDASQSGRLLQMMLQVSFGVLIVLSILGLAIRYNVRVLQVSETSRWHTTVQLLRFVSIEMLSFMLELYLLLLYLLAGIFVLGVGWVKTAPLLVLVALLSILWIIERGILLRRLLAKKSQTQPE